MKQTFLSLFAILMLAVQGFAGPVDSLSITSKVQISGERGELDYFDDGVDPSASGSASSNSVTVGSTKVYTYTFRSFSNHSPATLIDYSGGMYTISATQVGSGGQTYSIYVGGVLPWQYKTYYYKDWKVTVTYKPTSSGSHNAKLILYQGKVNISHTGVDLYKHTYSLSNKAVNPSPSITVNPASLSFGNVAKGKTATKTFTVKGTYLTGSLTVSSNNSYFTVSPTTITAAEAKAGKTITVTYKPTVTGSHSGTITVKGGGASSKTISVTGKGVAPSITVSTTTLVFGGYRDSRTFTVKGTDLTGNLTLTSSNSTFTVSPTTITASQAASGVTVTVKCNAALNVQHATGKITISGGDAASKIVNLTLDATSPQPYAGLVEPDDETDDAINGGEIEAAQETWGNSATAVNELCADFSIRAEGQNIIIESTVEQSAMISDIAGHARTVNLQSGTNVIPVNTNGVYIVRVREKTAKLMIK